MTTIKVTHRAEGWHCWPDAPVHRNYLRHVHRHLFHILVELEVTHDDREVEMHDLLDEVRGYSELLFELRNNNNSCEVMATSILKDLTTDYPGRFIAVEVWEDGEVGARVTSPSQGHQEAVDHLVAGDPTWQGRKGPGPDAPDNPPREAALPAEPPTSGHSSSPPHQDPPDQRSGADANPPVAGSGATHPPERLRSIVDHLSNAKRLITEAHDVGYVHNHLNQATEFINLALEELTNPLT